MEIIKNYSCNPTEKQIQAVRNSFDMQKAIKRCVDNQVESVELTAKVVWGNDVEFALIAGDDRWNILIGARGKVKYFAHEEISEQERSKAQSQADAIIEALGL